MCRDYQEVNEKADFCLREVENMQLDKQDREYLVDKFLLVKVDAMKKLGKIKDEGDDDNQQSK